MTMKKRTIVFDFGGVLFNTSAVDFYREHFQSQGRSEEELQFFLEKVFTNKDRSEANIGTVEEVVAKKAKQHPEWAEDILAFGTERAYLKHIRNVIPGMKEVLDDIIRNGDQIMGLTNWASDAYDVIPKAFPDILAHFNKVVVSGKVHLKKPDPEIFRLAQKEFGNPDVSEVYFFDDKPANVETARQTVGWNAVVFKDANTVRQTLALSPKAG
jgi:HAD superfamily hydrolase (TIGR01509 family)